MKIKELHILAQRMNVHEEKEDFRLKLNDWHDEEFEYFTKKILGRFLVRHPPLKRKRKR